MNIFNRILCFDDRGKPSIPIKDNPLIVVHPGFKKYCNIKKCKDYMERFTGYEDYLCRLKDSIGQADRSGRTVMVYTPSSKMRKTMEIVGSVKNLALVPNRGATPFLEGEHGFRDEEFYLQLSDIVSEAEVAGEFNQGCVSELEENAGLFLNLYRNPDIVFPSDKQANASPCYSFVNGVLTVPKKDFLVLDKDGDKFNVEMRRQRKNIIRSIKEKYEIKNGTCMSELLANLVKHSGIDDEREYYSFSALKSMNGMEKYSASSIRKAIKELEGRGLVDLRGLDKQEIDLFKKITKLHEADGIKMPMPRKMIVSNITVNSNNMGISKEDMGKFDANDIVKDMTAAELGSYKAEGFDVDEVIDIRGLTRGQKASKRQELYHKWKNEERKQNVPARFMQKRLNTIEEAKKKLEGMPHIGGKYLFGSYGTENQNPSSDIDMLLVRKSCPGAKDCCYKFKKGPIDLFCLSEDQMDELKRKDAMLLEQLRPLHSSFLGLLE